MFERYIKSNIYNALQDTPVVYIMGPRQSGKTTIVKDIIDEKWEYMTFDDSAQLTIAQADPVGFIRNIPIDKSIVLDEVQRLPELFVSIKQAVDEHRVPGRFLLTGSANALLLPTLSDSLAGRMEMIPLSTLSEYEILGKTPCFLQKLLQGEPPSTTQTRVRDYMIKRIVTGCFPEPLQREKEPRIRAWYESYLQSLMQKDIRDLGQIEHHSDMVKLVEILALYSGKLINFSDLGKKVGLNRVTVKKYFSLLQQLFLIEILPAWHSNATKRLVKTPKMHVTDTGIICAARGISTEQIRTNPDLYGSLLESFVFNELRKQSYFSDQKVKFSHYRDKDKVEVDVIIENSIGEVIGIEVKAASSISQKDLQGLKKLKEMTNKRFKIGVLLYDGDHTASFGDNLFAVPIASIWS